MAERFISPDTKGDLSLQLADIVRRSFGNFPIREFQPGIIHQSPYYTIARMFTRNHDIWATADGVGTKPELAERLYSLKRDPSVFEGLAYDTTAMVEGDEARFGRILLGITNILDVNSARDKTAMSALARGLEKVAQEGEFIVMNGETAELGYRVSGYGETHINWNMTGISLVIPEKVITGEQLAPGQPIVALREESIRSNGLSKARIILETAYLLKNGFISKADYYAQHERLKGKKGKASDIVSESSALIGHDIVEQVLPPWHVMFPETTADLLKPSKLYSPIIKDALGGVFGAKEVEMVAAAHISGGGIPEKAMRMVSTKGFGVSIESVFPDPEGVASLLAIANSFPEVVQQAIEINDRIGCEQWNRGIGFVVAVKNEEEAKKLIEIAGKHHCEAKIAGEVIDKPEIHFRGHVWKYEPQAV